MAIDKDPCPTCGEMVDATLPILECPVCMREGTADCCMQAGRNCLCVECEEGES